MSSKTTAEFIKHAKRLEQRELAESNASYRDSYVEDLRTELLESLTRLAFDDAVIAQLRSQLKAAEDRKSHSEIALEVENAALRAKLNDLT